MFRHRILQIHSFNKKMYWVHALYQALSGFPETLGNFSRANQFIFVIFLKQNSEAQIQREGTVALTQDWQVVRESERAMNSRMESMLDGSGYSLSWNALPPDIYMALLPILHFFHRRFHRQTDLNHYHPLILHPPVQLLFFITTQQYINSYIFVDLPPLKYK